MVKYKTIKIPECTYNEIKRAQKELSEKGLDNVPKDIIEKFNPNRDFTIGAIINMGVGRFHQHLERSKEKSNQKDAHDSIASV